MHFPGGPAAKMQVLPIQVQPLVRKLRSHMPCRERERGDTNRTNDSETSWATWSVSRSRLFEQAVASWVFPCRCDKKASLKTISRADYTKQGREAETGSW